MQAYESDTHEATLAEIRQHFGFVPAFFAPAQETPEILRQLWKHMQFAYIQSPLPVLFKEQLFTYFSRYSHVPYALVCHSCILYSLGTNSRELLALLATPIPTAAEIDDYLTILVSEAAPFAEWPASDSPLGKALFFCSIFVLLKPDLELSQRCSQQIRRLLGISNYNYLTMFFSFMKTCQTWIETHAEILPESDECIQVQYASLLAEEPRLANFFSTYYQQTRREQQTLSEQLAEKLQESQQLEAALRTAAYESTERANKLEAIIEAIADGLMIIDDEGRIVEANAVMRNSFSIDKATYMPLPLHELVKRSHFDLCDENGQSLPYEQWPAYCALKGERLTGAHTMDLMVVMDNGQRILVNISGVPIYDAQGNISGAITISRDVTERRRLEGSMRETNRRMDEFLSMASHELKTPLTSIITNIQLAERRLNKLCRQQEMAVQDLTAKVETIQELLSSADRQVWRLNRLVDELLDVSRIQANKLELRVAQHNLLTIVREAIEQQRQITPQRIIILQLPIQQEMRVNVDGDRIGQVIMNYTSNALKYSDPEQPIKVSVEVDREEHRVRVGVHDRGPGLPLAEQERIWDRFYRVQGIEVQSGMSIGLGLGLHICKRIVERHAGQVGVESRPGQGSTFWFTLSLAQ